MLIQTGQTQGIGDFSGLFDRATEGALAGQDLFALILTTLKGGVSTQTDQAEEPLLQVSTTEEQALPVDPARELLSQILSGQALTDAPETLGDLLEVIESLDIKDFDVSQLNSLETLAAAYEKLGATPEEALVQAKRVQNTLQALKAEFNLTDEDVFSLALAKTATAPITLSATVEEIVLRQKVSDVMREIVSKEPVIDVAKRILEGLPLTEEPLTEAEKEILMYKENTAASTTLEEIPLEQTVEHTIESVEKGLLQEPVARRKGSFVGETFIKTPQTPVHETNTLKATDIAEKQIFVTKSTPVHVQKEAVEISSEKPIVPVVQAKDLNARRSDTFVKTPQANASLAANENGEVVTPKTVLKTPKGHLVYEWSVTRQGFDVLEQRADIQTLKSAMMEEAAGKAKAATDLDMEITTATDKKSTSFSEKLVQLSQRSHVAKQTILQIQKLADQGGGTVRLQLHPESLGKVDIELKIADGAVRGVISVQSPEVLEQLARDLHILKQGLSDAGFSLADEGMKFLLTDGDDDDAGNATNFEEGDDTYLATDDAASDAPQNWVSPERIMDIRV